MPSKTFSNQECFARYVSKFVFCPSEYIISAAGRELKTSYETVRDDHSSDGLCYSFGNS